MHDNRLEDHFKLVKKHPWFEDLFQDIHHYQDAPILEKKGLSQILEKKFDLANEETGVYLVRSGVTSQKPLVFPVDIQENRVQRQLLAEQLKKEDIIGPKKIILNLFPYAEMYRTASILDDIIERCDATTLTIGSKPDHDLLYQICLKYRPNMMMGTPSTLSKFATYLKKTGKEINPLNLLFGGEFLLPSTQKEIVESIKIEDIYALYGAAELGIWGWANHLKSPSTYRILEDLVVEIRNPDEEGFGSVIVTNLMRKRFPVLRYNTGDIGKLGEDKGQSTLILKSREQKSFLLDANSYFTYEFEKVLEHAADFQIQLGWKKPPQSWLKFLLLPREGKEMGADLCQELSEAVRSVIGYGEEVVSIEVLPVKEREFYSNPVTSKTPMVIDFRD